MCPKALLLLALVSGACASRSCEPKIEIVVDSVIKDKRIICMTMRIEPRVNCVHLEQNWNLEPRSGLERKSKAEPGLKSEGEILGESVIGRYERRSNDTDVIHSFRLHAGGVVGKI
ncbi:hypothetical protein EVAR_15727_1 [Eumeta japonica]|uniref:Uncharacterized protein n=1 Tax=Eumeta variegata TaxID=151549 RepID=A0A4C1U9J5_EUMVA|nr:hypothetical protein EVAR_15727_1 [Eumeta japonica]